MCRITGKEKDSRLKRTTDIEDNQKVEDGVGKRIESQEGIHTSKENKAPVSNTNELNRRQKEKLFTSYQTISNNKKASY